jgi:hypothetical protein
MVGTHPGRAFVKLSTSLLPQVAVLAGILIHSARGIGAEGILVAREGPGKATSSKAAREDALQAIPMTKLSAEGKAKAGWVLSHSSVFRRMPIRVIPCDPDMYLFLVQHPDVVVNIWEIMGASHLAVQQTGPDGYKVSDDIGTAGSIEFLYRSHDTHVVYVEGAYTGSLFGQPIRARGLLLLKSGYLRETDGRYYITCRLDAFMHIEPSGVEFLTKTFLPMVSKVADNNFTQTAAFLASVSRTAEVNLRGMQRLASKLSKVQPEIRQEFAQVAERVAQRVDPAKPLPAADLKTSPLLQTPHVASDQSSAGSAPQSTATAATPAGTSSRPTP